MKRTGLARKSLAIAARDLFLLASNLATGVVVARVLGPASFGVWAIFQLIVSYAEALGRPKFDQAAVFYLGRGTYDLGRMTFVLHMLAAGSAAIVLAVIGLGINPLYGVLFKDVPDVHALLPIVLLQIPAQFLYLNYAYVHIGREDVGSYNRMTILRAVLNSGLSVVSLLVLRAGLTGVVWATLLSTLAGFAYGAVLLHREVPIRVGWDGRMVADLASYGGKLYVAGAVGQLNNQLTNALCAVYLVPAQLAFFSLASARRDVVNVLPNAVNTILFPRISATPGHAEAARLTATTARVVFLALLLVGAAGFLLVGPAVSLLYGTAYLPVVELFRALLPGFILYGGTSPYLQYFLGVGRPDLTVTLAIPAVIVQVLLAAWLIPVIGLNGAALALLVPLLLGAVLIVVAFLRLSDMTIADALLVRRSDLTLLRDIAQREVAHLRSTGGRGPTAR